MADDLMDDPAIGTFDLAVVNWQRNGRLAEHLDRIIDDAVVLLIRRRGAGVVMPQGALLLRRLRVRASRMMPATIRSFDETVG